VKTQKNVLNVEINKGSVVKLTNGEEATILNLPTSFMANGSYEIVVGNTKKWVKPEEILYEIDVNHKDDLNNYFEIIMDESGINLIPKDVNIIDIESDRDDMNRIKITLHDGRKHNVVNIHVGNSKINDVDKITTKPKKPKKKSKLKKILDNIIKNDE